MKKLLLTATVLAAFYMPASAQIVDDPLHSVVCGSGGTGCVNTDNGSFAPLPAGVVTNWGFEISPPNSNSGTLFLGVLVPTNSIDASTFNLPTLTDNGGGPLTETVVSRSVLFTSANGSNLASYLGLGNNFSPTDNFSNASAGEATLNPSFNGKFLAFTVAIPGVTLDAQGSTTIANDFSFGANLPAGTVIAGFFTFTDSKGMEFVGTAASGDLVVSPVASAVPEPATWGMMLLGFIGLGFAFRQRRRMVGLAA
jgi:PEP-CTERM motif